MVLVPTSFIDRGALLDRVYPSKVIADVSRKYTLSYASQDTVALNAILCTTSGALYAHSGDVKHGFYATYFKGQAIHHLKNELSKDDGYNLKISTAYAVSLLLWIEGSTLHLECSAILLNIP